MARKLKAGYIVGVIQFKSEMKIKYIITILFKHTFITEIKRGSKVHLNYPICVELC